MIGVHSALLFVSILYGISYVLIKDLLVTVPPGAWATLRVILSTVIFTLINWRVVKNEKWTMFHLKWFAILGFFGIVLNQVCFIEGLARTTAIHSAIINSTIPAMTLIFGVMLGTERWTPAKLAGVILSLIGILILVEAEKFQIQKETFVGDMLSIVNSASFSLYFALSAKVRGQINARIMTIGMFAVGVLGIGIYGGISMVEFPWVQLQASHWYTIAYLIVGTTILTYLLNNWALARAEGSLVAIYINVQPLIAAMMSHYMGREELTTRKVLAGLLVASGILILGLLPLLRKLLLRRSRA